MCGNLWNQVADDLLKHCKNQISALDATGIITKEQIRSKIPHDSGLQDRVLQWQYVYVWSL